MRRPRWYTIALAVLGIAAFAMFWIPIRIAFIRRATAARAISRRSGMVSMAMTRSAPIRMALRMANLPSKFLQLKKYSINRQMDIKGFSAAIRTGAEMDALLAEVEEKMKAVLESLVIDTGSDHNTQQTARRVAKTRAAGKPRGERGQRNSPCRRVCAGRREQACTWIRSRPKHPRAPDG